MKSMLIAILVAGTLRAADVGDWKNLDRLKAGDRVGVIAANLKRVEGKFEAVTPTGIRVDAVEVARDQVVRVYRKGGAKQWKGALIGAGVGVAVGVLIAQTAGKRFENEGQEFLGVSQAGWVAISIGAGAGLGAWAGSESVTVYRRK